jgi:nucleoside-diphosphate-sugar epimerase
MKVLVTGSEGFIGSFLVPAIEKEHEVVRYDRVLGLEVLDSRTLTKYIEDCDAVLHLAGLPMYDPKYSAADYAVANYETAMAVGSVCEDYGLRMVFVSSGALYGFGPSDKGWVEPPITEEKSPIFEQMDDYSICKFETEVDLLNLFMDSRTGATLFILRPNCIEPHDEGAKNGDHWGWRTSQETLTKAVLAALIAPVDGALVVNVSTDSPNVSTKRLEELLANLE